MIVTYGKGLQKLETFLQSLSRMSKAVDNCVSKVCLFVRNIPYSTTDADLHEVFQHYGTLRACFTVKDKGIIYF